MGDLIQLGVASKSLGLNPAVLYCALKIARVQLITTTSGKKFHSWGPPPENTLTSALNRQIYITFWALLAMMSLWLVPATGEVWGESPSFKMARICLIKVFTD